MHGGGTLLGGREEVADGPGLGLGLGVVVRVRLHGWTTRRWRQWACVGAQAETDEIALSRYAGGQAIMSHGQ